MMDTGTIIYIAIFAWIAVWVLDHVNQWIGPRRQMVDRPKDVHGMVMRRYKRAAALNRPRHLRRLSFRGDPHYPPQRIGRITGILMAPEITHIFFKPSWYSFTRWAVVPAAMHGALHGQELVIAANGLSPVGNHYEPVFPKQMSASQVREMRTLIDSYVRMIVMREENVELVEQQANAEFISINARVQPKTMIRREDYLPQSPARVGDDDE